MVARRNLGVLSGCSRSHPLRRQEGVLKKQLRKTLPAGMGRAEREWIRTCLDCLRDMAKPVERSALPPTIAPRVFCATSYAGQSRPASTYVQVRSRRGACLSDFQEKSPRLGRPRSIRRLYPKPLCANPKPQLGGAGSDFPSDAADKPGPRGHTQDCLTWVVTCEGFFEQGRVR
jgi:hypothetical protein